MTLDEQFGCHFECRAVLLFPALALVRLHLPWITSCPYVVHNLARFFTSFSQRHRRVPTQRHACESPMDPGHDEPGLRARVGDAKPKGGKMRVIVVDRADAWRGQPVD